MAPHTVLARPKLPFRLSSHRDRDDPQFLALVLAIQACVFWAVPRKWLPPGLNSGLRALVFRCLDLSERILDESPDVGVLRGCDRRS